ncbi:MAG: helix-turn-helix transcriptional regulator [Acholeplasmatales bacterium]|nr:helix-turn-helix transcriptional regulator [Acholeplasmatales bacterium]
MSILLYEDPKLAKFISKLKKARISKGFTQEALSELSEVNIKSIASYEQNPAKLNAASVSTVSKLADALGCDIEDVINWDYEKKASNNVDIDN